MDIVEKIPLKLRKVFAEVANIPAAVGCVPTIMVGMLIPGFIREPIMKPLMGNDNGPGWIFTSLTAIAMEQGLTHGLPIVPVLTMVASVPLYLAGRIIQGINQNNPPGAHRFFHVDY
jgi:hypothetical protein